MISVVIPTLNAEQGLPATLTALVQASVEGIVREVVVADCGSSDATLQIAEDAGAKIVIAEKGRGNQLAAGAREAKGPWLLFLHADTQLQKDWCKDAAQFIHLMDSARGRSSQAAAVFQFALDDRGLKPRLLESLVWLRGKLFKLPYGDQGLLIKKNFYDRLGGYSPIPLMEDVDLVCRIGRKRMHFLHTRAVTSASRYQTQGYLRRSTRNLYCLGLYFRGVDPAEIVEHYERGRYEASK